MPRLPERTLAVCAGIALIAHGVVLAPRLALPGLEASALIGAEVALVQVLQHALTGRVALAFFPPGEIGSHAWRDLAATAAASLTIGAILWFLLLARIPLPAHILIIVLALALVRWLTLPGAMVPRHPPPEERAGTLDRCAALAALAWTVALPLVVQSQLALEWWAVFVLVFHALGVARRRRAGRWAVLALGALLCVPLGSYRPGSTWIAALPLALGACALIPWLRRADRRAGMLAAFAFGSLCAAGSALLALGSALVLVLGSHPRQRRFAAVATLAWAAPFALVEAWRANAPPPGRGRLLSLPLLVERALGFSDWGLAWPLVAAALAAGALAFPWRARPWAPGTIEEPRREARALAALLVVACAVLALPSVPWDEDDALALLFAPCCLLAGALLIPPERAPARPA